jgi:hypothetical protein
MRALPAVEAIPLKLRFFGTYIIGSGSQPIPILAAIEP